MPLIMDGGGEALGQANLPVNTPGARGLQSLRTRRPPRHQPGWSAQRWEENIVVLGYNRPEANLVGVFQNGCFTPAILSKTYTRFVHFYEKFRLEGLGYEVVTETSSRAAFALFVRQPDRFDLVITDMTMPGMTGKELAHELRRIRPDIPIILCTGFSPHLNEEQIKALGMCTLLKKPFALQELAETIRAVLQQRPG